MVFTEYRRYLFNFLSAAISLILVFTVILGGMQGLAAAEGISLGSSLEAMIVGLLIWTVAIFAYQSWSYGIVREAQTGTLEQLYLSPWGFRWVSLGRLIGDLLPPLTFAAIPLALGFFIARRPLHIDLLTLVPILLATIVQAWGIGLMLGGLALIFKRVEASFQIVQWLFVGLIAMSGAGRSWLLLSLPLVLGSRVARQSLINAVPLWRQPEAPWLAAVTLLWLLLGMLVYRQLERVAVNRGRLGQY